jgi:hypothetical protein
VRKKRCSNRNLVCWKCRSVAIKEKKDDGPHPQPLEASPTPLNRKRPSLTPYDKLGRTQQRKRLKAAKKAVDEIGVPLSALAPPLAPPIGTWSLHSNRS